MEVRQTQVKYLPEFQCCIARQPKECEWQSIEGAATSRAAWLRWDSALSMKNIMTNPPSPLPPPAAVYAVDPMVSPSRSGRLLTPSKITAWLDCAHYLTLRRAVDAGAIAEPATGFGAFARLLMDKGLAPRARLPRAARGRGPRRPRGARRGTTGSRSPSGPAASATRSPPATTSCTRCRSSTTGSAASPTSSSASTSRHRSASFRYEPVDAKLARAEAKPGHVLQLCFYAEALDRASRAQPPDGLHLHLGSGRTESIRLVDVQPYWRRLRDQLAGSSTPSDPARHRAGPLCPLRLLRVRRDVRGAVAGRRTRCTSSPGSARPRSSALDAAGVDTLAALAPSGSSRSPAPRRSGSTSLRRQAGLQRARGRRRAAAVGSARHRRRDAARPAARTRRRRRRSSTSKAIRSGRPPTACSSCSAC